MRIQVSAWERTAIQYADARDYQCGEPEQRPSRNLGTATTAPRQCARIYQSFEQVKATLLNFGIAENTLDEAFKLLPQLGTGEHLHFPPVHVPHHDLVAQGFKLATGWPRDRTEPTPFAIATVSR